MTGKKSTTLTILLGCTLLPAVAAGDRHGVRRRTHHFRFPHLSGRGATAAGLLSSAASWERRSPLLTHSTAPSPSGPEEANPGTRPLPGSSSRPRTALTAEVSLVPAAGEGGFAGVAEECPHD